MEYKCLHIITRLANGGAEESVLDLILELAKQGIYADLAVGRECLQEVLEKYDLPRECTIHRVPYLVRNPSPLFDLLALSSIRKLIYTHKYNIVETHGSKAGILGRIAAHKTNVPAIISMVHGISFPPSIGLLSRVLYKKLEKYVATFTHAFVCVGEDMRQKYISAGIGHPEQYSVIYTGMHLAPFIDVANKTPEERIVARVKFGLPSDLHITVLGVVARLEDRKNQKALIEMLPRILAINDKVHLCLIGDGPNQNMLEVLAEKLGVSTKVTFTGYVPRVWEILPAINIHCMVSLWEGLPRVLVQTAAAALPNVCYEVDGAWEIVTHNISGYVVPHGDTDAFIEQVGLLIADENLRTQFGKAAATLADYRWSIESYGKRTAQLYRVLLSGEACAIPDAGGQARDRSHQKERK